MEFCPRIVIEFTGQDSGLARRLSFRCCDGIRATRKPRLLFRFSGVFLLRFAERQFGAVLFQLPLRITRFVPCDH